ncbi:hypothetical protein LMTR13_26065 [Bradyrhizobium icense]|uniref:Uncharacterized protein n=1 Tax=Bradyrhizobium icense TaxID=1274631 RepID=A0A1B1UK14_9BRAD|nr:hypothetical protein LMTR13_26065 [Bradyrhizobium icense]
MLVNAGTWGMPDMLAEALGSTFGERLIELLGHGAQKVFELIEKHSIEWKLSAPALCIASVGRRKSRPVLNNGRSAVL